MIWTWMSEWTCRRITAAHNSRAAAIAYFASAARYRAAAAAAAAATIRRFEHRKGTACRRCLGLESTVDTAQTTGRERECERHRRGA